MVVRERQGDFWPTFEQELLLKACLMEEEIAAVAWQQWSSRVDMAGLDQSSHRLLPLLLHNLNACGWHDPLMGKLKEVRKAYWFSTQLLLRQVAPVVRALAESNIETMLLKGAALGILHYEGVGLRPMEDVDILVPLELAPHAIGLLRKMGWQPKAMFPNVFRSAYLSIKHAFEFRNAAGQTIDLHWHVLDECLQRHDDDDFWLSAVPVQIQNVSTCALNPTDQLIHVCVHGSRWNATPTIRWVADALTVLRGTKERIDWERLFAQACKRELILPLRFTLSYLKEAFNAAIPATLIDRLWDCPVTDRAREEYAIQTSSPEQLGVFWRVHRQKMRYLRLARNAGLSRKIMWLVEFLQLGVLELFRDVLLPHFSGSEGSGVWRKSFFKKGC